MKKFTLAIVAIVLGFGMISCNKSAAIRDAIITKADLFFTDGEQRLQATTNVEEFMDFVSTFNDERSEFSENIFDGYLDKDGDIKGISDEDFINMTEAINAKIETYDKAEENKCVELMTRDMDRFENAFQTLIEAFESEDEDQVDAIENEFEEVLDVMAAWEDYEFMPENMRERYDAIEQRVADFFSEFLSSLLGEDE